MSTISFTFPHGLMINASHLKEKKGLQTNEFKEICKAFLALHVVQNHGSRLCKRIFPLSNLALPQPILGFTLISVLAMLNIVRVISNVSFRTTGDIAYCCQRFGMN